MCAAISFDPLKHRLKKVGIEAGCDEAGRGCLAGPVCAAAVILPERFRLPSYIKDSKQLNKETRQKAAAWVKKRAIAWCVGYCSPEEIDRINILQASFKAMHRALDGLPVRPDRILVDGNRFVKYGDLEHHCIVKGDNLYASIAAASIMAKVHRDHFMQLWHEDYPYYDWWNNKGYATARHIDALHEKGRSHLHRLSFSINSSQLSLF